MDLIDYIYDECQRQHVTNYGDFAKAWQLARDPYKPHGAKEMSIFVMALAYKVDPVVNSYAVMNRRYDNLRTSHVGFMHGGSAVPAGEVRERFNRWCELAYEIITDLPIDDTLVLHFVDSLIKQLLDIHPWADGNGRTASVLRNWMMGTLDNPEPLPYYYGES